MADRSFHRPDTQGVRHVHLVFSVIYAAGAPQFVEGDKAGALAGSYVTLAQAGAGLMTVTTNNPYMAVVFAKANLAMATPNGNSLAPITGKPVANANGTFSVNISTAVNAAGTHTATTPANGDMLMVHLVLRNSQSLP